MNVEITARHASVSSQVKDHVHDRLEQVLRHAGSITSIHVILDAEKARQMAEFIVHGRNLSATVHAESDDMWTSIDRCAEKLRHQLEHLNGRHRVKRRRSGSLSAAEAELAARAEAAAREDADAAMEPKEKRKAARDAARALANPAPRLPAIVDDGIVREPRRELRTLSAKDARTQYEGDGSEPVVFRDAKTGRVSVLFRRRDGRLALIDAGAP